MIPFRICFAGSDEGGESSLKPPHLGQMEETLWKLLHTSATDELVVVRNSSPASQ
jgi:hypothetical protein